MNAEAADSRNDAELLRAVADGDQMAFRVLYDRHAPWLMVWLSRRSPNQGVVDDVLQKTFIAVWEKPDNWRGEGEVAAWIRRIAIHKLLDEIQPRSKIRAAVQLVATVFDIRGEAEPSAEEELWRRRGLPYGELGDALGTLPPDLLAVVQCCWLDELTTSEASQALGVPQGTVKTRLMRARIRMREELGCELGCNLRKELA
jgi:RNA polymerase sigma-70 factor (ECF subfamily)